LSNQGWIKLHRKLKDSPLYRDCNSKQRDILINLLLAVNHKPNKWIFKGEEYEVKQGQIVTSLESIANMCAKDVTVQNVRTALLKFEKHGFLTNKSTNKNRLITVVNWQVYQGEEENQQTNQQAINKQLTTNKNVKNDKNKKLYVETSNEYRLAKYLFEHMRRNNPNAKEPNYQTWCKQLDYVIRLDKRDLEEVKKVISWCQNDNFWLGNILSPLSLRKNYDKLLIKMNQEQQITEKPKVKIGESKIDFSNMTPEQLMAYGRGE
jgi:hypothetical protein